MPDPSQAPQGVNWDNVLQGVDQGQVAPENYQQQRQPPLQQPAMPPPQQDMYNQAFGAPHQQLQQFMQQLQAMKMMQYLKSLYGGGPQHQFIEPGALGREGDPNPAATRRENLPAPGLTGPPAPQYPAN